MCPRVGRGALRLNTGVSVRVSPGDISTAGLREQTARPLRVGLMPSLRPEQGHTERKDLPLLPPVCLSGLSHLSSPALELGLTPLAPAISGLWIQTGITTLAFLGLQGMGSLAAIIT